MKKLLLTGVAGFAAWICLSGCRHVPPRYFSDYNPNSRRAVGLHTTTLTNTLDPEWMRAPTNLFTLGPGDRVEIELVGDAASKVTTVVGPDGRIYFNLLPGLEVWGLTLGQARELIEHELAKYIRNTPRVNLTLRDVESKRIWLLGRFQVPGVYNMSGPMTLLEAISMAGGILDGVDLAQAYVARGTQRVPVDFVRLMRQGDLTQNITLNPDDTIVLPDNPQLVIYVMGEVKLPGMLPFVKERNWTVTKAVAAVGGFTQYAARGRSYLIREEGGKKLTIPIDFNDLMKNPEAGKDVPLSAGDILVVPQSLF